MGSGILSNMQTPTDSKPIRLENVDVTVDELGADDAEQARLQRRADDIMNALSKEAQQKILALTQARGINRHTRRATASIVRKDLRRQKYLAAKEATRQVKAQSALASF